MTDRELMQMALDALTVFREWEMGQDYNSNRETVLARAFKAEEALRTALAQGEQEPFGYFKAEPFGWTDCAETDEGAIPLYERPVAPLQREWQGLTDEELCDVCEALGVTVAGPASEAINALFRAIEAKLKEKNS